jgi:hypothetical protein
MLTPALDLIRDVRAERGWDRDCIFLERFAHLFSAPGEVAASPGSV